MYKMSKHNNFKRNSIISQLLLLYISSQLNNESINHFQEFIYSFQLFKIHGMQQSNEFEVSLK